MIIVILGPTGVGKTRLSVELAKRYNAEVINADSMQVYKELNIGTAKVTEKEKENVPHHLFDIKNPDELYTVYDYQRDLRNILDNNKNKNFNVFFLLHGLYGNEKDWTDPQQGSASVIFDELIYETEAIEPMVVIMPDGGNTWYIDSKEKIQTAYEKDLFPFIFKNYRVSNERDKVQRAMDKINKKYGNNTIKSAALFDEDD